MNDTSRQFNMPARQVMSVITLQHKEQSLCNYSYDTHKSLLARCRDLNLEEKLSCHSTIHLPTAMSCKGIVSNGSESHRHTHTGSGEGLIRLLFPLPLSHVTHTYFCPLHAQETKDIHWANFFGRHMTGMVIDPGKTAQFCVGVCVY